MGGMSYRVVRRPHHDKNRKYDGIQQNNTDYYKTNYCQQRGSFRRSVTDFSGHYSSLSPCKCSPEMVRRQYCDSE
ncbi:hypothetical protein TNCV_454251 [Trichonephila clavipes]|nr:hypothetical protein TNCV_454251 [Trichonephila clavipes]